MRKVEDLAKELYPDWETTGVPTFDGQEESMVRIQRAAYIAGYHQAEKDLLENKHETSWRLDEKLWSGIKDVEEASYQYMYDASNDWAYEIPTWKDVQDAFKAGSEWKENLELTYDDICEIMEIREDVLEMDSYENLYKEILKRFKDFKERKEK